MKTNSINTPPFSSKSYSDEDIHSRRKHNNYFKHYYNSGLPLIMFMGLTTIFSVFLVYSANTLRFSSGTHHKQPQLSFNTRAPIKTQSGDGKCDLFTGKWIHDLNGSQYTMSNCITIPESKNCFKNGRIDRDFVNWRWKPVHCELPKFNPHKFLQMLSGKKLAFIGDSVARNHMESLLCLLSQVETPMDVYKDSEDRCRTWYFTSSNFTLMMIWSKFLVNSQERILNGSSTGGFNLHFDKVDDKWASKLPILDYVIISDAHWFFRKNYLYSEGKLIGCVYCNEPNITELGIAYALRMSFRAALKHINKCKDCKKGMMTLVRTLSPGHFENGAWNTQGGCNRTSPHTQNKTKELFEMSFEFQLRKIQMEEVERAFNEVEGEEKKFRAMDVTFPMFMRPDGHPGEFWGNKWKQGYNDCVHWCMPGPIDVWSDFLLAVLFNEVG